ncbi:MAG: hypothetical protein ABI167_10295 [Nitrosospira sp.]
MSKQKLETRNLAFEGTQRTTLQLEPEAWALIDEIARVKGQEWAMWVRQEAKDTPTGVSRSAWLRKRAMKVFREIADTRDAMEVLFRGRAEAIEGDPFTNPEFDEYLAVLDEERITEHLAECEVEGTAELGGYNLHVGFDEFGRRCFWIENQLKGFSSLVISIPASEVKK